jgi:MarR-like DNA-binding transcriptional regulator SgrR of sgrS sRNA
MFDILFGSGSLGSYKKENRLAINQLEKKFLFLKKENEEIKYILSEIKEAITQQQISIGIILTAHQNLSDEIGRAYDILKSITSSSSPHSFEFSFRDYGDDDLDN